MSIWIYSHECIWYRDVMERCLLLRWEVHVWSPHFADELWTDNERAGECWLMLIDHRTRIGEGNVHDVV